MGLTVHFEFRAPPATDARAALGYIKQLHAFCEDRPFAEVDRQVVHFEGAGDCDFESAPRESAERWMKIQARTWIHRTETRYHPDEQDRRYGHDVGSKVRMDYDVKPVEMVAFSAWPGAGCESLELGLARYPDRFEFWDRRYSRRPRHRVLKTRLAGRWRWRAFCKTQYASQHGLPHFLRCHLLVVAVLDRARQLGLLQRVNDEGDYWKHRRLDQLAHAVAGYNTLVGALAKLLKEAAPPGHEVRSEIEHHPDYPQFSVAQLAADFPEMRAAVARTADVLRRTYGRCPGDEPEKGESREATARLLVE